MVENKEVIRQAYENSPTASARLAAFASCTPTDSSKDLINDRQKVLATDDLVIFAIHARRLMESCAWVRKFIGVRLGIVGTGKGSDQPGISDMAIIDVVSKIVHHKVLLITRFDRELVDVTGMSDFDAYLLFVKAGDGAFPPRVLVQSDRGGPVAFKLGDLIEIFEKEVIVPIVDACADDGLYLDNSFTNFD